MLSPEYQAILTEQRALTPTWGGAKRHALPVMIELQRMKIASGTILDYGAGAGNLKPAIERLSSFAFMVDCYEPGVPEWATLPSGPYTAVVCTHVLEHVEPAHLAATLEEIRTRARAMIYVEVPHGPARKTLPDGRDAHLIQESPDWWYGTLRRAFGANIEQRFGANPVNTVYIWRKPA